MLARRCKEIPGRVDIYQGDGLRCLTQAPQQERKEKEVKMLVISNGIECFCLPDCAVCQSCHKRMNEIQECPEHNDSCDADCEYYAELWDEKDLKEELAKDEDKLLLDEAEQ